jgi:hypothetical protein
MNVRLPVAGEKNPGRTRTDNAPIIPDRVVEFTKDETGMQMLTVTKLGLHEYEGFTLYQDPHFMQWHIIDKDGKEPLGVTTQRDLAHRAIDKHNANIYKANIISRIEYEASQAEHKA